MQSDFDSNYPELNIQILGINQTSHQGGNPSITAGRDIPWLQDEDLDMDGSSDVWLNSWPFSYRDVVIVDESNVVVDTYNLTTHDLDNVENYDTLRQMFLDAAIHVVELQEDLVEVPPGMAIDIPVLKNDGLPSTSSWGLSNVGQPSGGAAEILTLSFPADLEPKGSNATTVLISEVRPGEYIELFNPAYADRALDTSPRQLVAGTERVSLDQLGAGQTIAARGYLQLTWPTSFVGDSSGGELLLYGETSNEVSNPLLVEDFVTWGTSPAVSHRDLAIAANRWEGASAPTLSQGSIHRRPATNGTIADDYDTQSPASPGGAVGSAVTTLHVIRFTADAMADGETTFDYTVSDGGATTGVAPIRVLVSAQARPWRNPLNHVDIDGDGTLAPRDALLVVNYLNRGLQGPLSSDRLGVLASLPYLDANGNNSSEPADLLQVVNALNGTASGEGESPPRTALRELDAWDIPSHGDALRVDAINDERPLIALFPPPSDVNPTMRLPEASQTTTGETDAAGTFQAASPANTWLPGQAIRERGGVESNRTNKTMASQALAADTLFAEWEFQGSSPLVR